jgi:tetratricopeptide (TPR) repeat protein
MRTDLSAFSLLAVGVAAAQTAPERMIVAGHWKQARAIVEQRIRENSRDALATYMLSMIRNAFGDHESPLTLAEKAVALDGSVGKYHRQLAEALGVKAQHSGMLQQLFLAHRFRKEIDTAIALDPGDIQAKRDLMEFYLLAPGVAGGDKRKAESAAEAIARVDPCAGFSAQVRLAEFRSDKKRAAEFLRKAVEADPHNYRARIALAEFTADQEEAEREAKAAVGIDAGQVAGYAVLARVYARRGKWPELDAVLTEAEKQVPDDLVPYYRAAEQLLESHQESPRAERYLLRYLRMESEGNQPTRADTLKKLAQVRAAQ